MNPYGDIDLTRYLQTEGRRRAAALAAERKARGAPFANTHAQQQCDGGSGQHPPGQRHSAQQQQGDASPPATSLREVLIQMGIT